MSLSLGLKRLARRALGAVSPALLRDLDRARRRAYYRHEPTRGPRHLLLEPTSSCNYQCEMCLSHSPRRTVPYTSHTMPFELVSRLLHDAAALGIERVWLAGQGEPLLHPQAVEMLELIGTLGMRSAITTNGTRLSEEVAERLCDHGLAEISVSLNAACDDTYARIHHARGEHRTRLLRLLAHLARRTQGRPALTASMVITGLNAREVVPFTREAVAAGVDAVVLAGMRPVAFDAAGLALRPDDWRQVRADIEQARALTARAGIVLRVDGLPPEAAAQSTEPAEWPYARMACFIGHRFAAIDAEGTVHGCCSCQNRLGSLKEASLGEIWHSSAYRTYRRLLRNLPVTGLTPPMCECRYGCGHVPENAAVQEELRLTFTPRPPGREFATRADMAVAVYHGAADLLPHVEPGPGFTDVPSRLHPDAPRAVAFLQGLAVSRGAADHDARQVFDPHRIIARSEIVEALRRVLQALGPEANPEALSVLPAGAPADSQPITPEELRVWLSTIAPHLRRAR